MTPLWSRRQALLLSGVVMTAGCAAPPETTAASTSTPVEPSAPPVDTPTSPSSSAPASPSPSTADTPSTTTTDSAPTRPPPWSPDPNDVSPAAKTAATRHIQTTQGPPFAEVVFAQYGGILTNQASVLVVTHQWGADSTTGRTYDVRLVRSGTSWQVTDVLPSDPGPPATVSPAGRQVLAEPNISLPPAARADITSGHVHDSVLETLLTLAQTFRIAVSVVRSGHPTYVFGTARLSDHPFGRAFDTWRINNHSVVAASTPAALVTAYMEAAAKAGSYNIGGPYLPSGPQYFSDPTHHDHVHIGFRS